MGFRTLMGVPEIGEEPLADKAIGEADNLCGCAPMDGGTALTMSRALIAVPVWCRGRHLQKKGPETRVTDRIAIISSPRSGNSWLRWLLRDCFDLSELAVHNFRHAVALPERCVLQLHWYREPNFQRFLRENRFRPIVIARHPLDVLVSVLHFVRYEPETAEWLGGNCEIPSTLRCASPASVEFLDYALSYGAENLLCVSYQWWHDNSAIKVRYEDMVADIAEQIGYIADQLSVSRPPPEKIPANVFQSMRAAPNRHGWQGRPGLWKELIPFADATRILEHHRRLFDFLGYSVERSSLTAHEARANWQRYLR